MRNIKGKTLVNSTDILRNIESMEQGLIGSTPYLQAKHLVQVFNLDESYPARDMAECMKKIYHKMYYANIKTFRVEGDTKNYWDKDVVGQIMLNLLAKKAKKESWPDGMSLLCTTPIEWEEV